MVVEGTRLAPAPVADATHNPDVNLICLDAPVPQVDNVRVPPDPKKKPHVQSLS